MKFYKFNIQYIFNTQVLYKYTEVHLYNLYSFMVCECHKEDPDHPAQLSHPKQTKAHPSIPDKQHPPAVLSGSSPQRPSKRTSRTQPHQPSAALQVPQQPIATTAELFRQLNRYNNKSLKTSESHQPPAEQHPTNPHRQ